MAAIPATLRAHSDITLTTSAAIFGGAFLLYRLRRRRIDDETKRAKANAAAARANIKVPQRVKSDQLGPIVDALAAMALQPPPNGAARWIVALCGIPGSGKSTLAFTLQHAVNGKIAQLKASRGITDEKEAFTAITMDGFHYSRAELDRLPNPALAHRRRGVEWTFDVAKFSELLDKLLTVPGRLTAPAFDHAAKDPQPDALVIEEHHRMVLVDGIYTLLQNDPWDRLVADRWHYRIFIECPMDIAKERVVRRHVATGISNDRRSAAFRYDDNDGPNSIFIEGNLRRSELDWIIETKQDASRMAPSPKK